MTVRIRIEPDTLENISKLVKDGKYKTNHDFISLAIENQLQDELDEESTFEQNSIKSEKTSNNARQGPVGAAMARPVLGLAAPGAWTQARAHVRCAFCFYIRCKFRPLRIASHG